MGELNRDAIDRPSPLTAASEYFQAVTKQFAMADACYGAALAASAARDACLADGDEVVALNKQLAAIELLGMTHRYIVAGTAALLPCPKGWEQVVEFFRVAALEHIDALVAMTNEPPERAEAQRLADRGHAHFQTALTLAAERMMGEDATTVHDSFLKRGFSMFAAMLGG